MSYKKPRKIPITLEEKQLIAGVFIFSGIAFIFCLLILGGLLT